MYICMLYVSYGLLYIRIYLCKPPLHILMKCGAEWRDIGWMMDDLVSYCCSATKRKMVNTTKQIIFFFRRLLLFRSARTS